ncbi:unnamed protein product [Sphagnum jensenii]|uniref:VQ domain-containing protein n=1 Tax=Sphagnum jensenii TaxID=128206 RepID=A0ABP1BRK8_9BRYO
MIGKLGRGSISSRLPSPTSVLQEEAGMASSEGQLEPGAHHQVRHGSPSRGNGSWSTRESVEAGIIFGLADSKLLKESLELELRFREVPSSSAAPIMITSAADDQVRPAGNSAGGMNLYPDDPHCTSLYANLLAQDQQPGLVVNGRNKAISKRRPRASRRVPTTVLEASCTDFRGMVQKLTGIAVEPASALQKAAGAPDPLADAHIVRPQPKRANVETVTSSSDQTSDQSGLVVQQAPTQSSLQMSQQAQAPQVPDLSNFARQSCNQLAGDDSTRTPVTGNNFLGYNNNGVDIMATLYGAWARSTGNIRSPTAAAGELPMKTSSPAASVSAFTDSAAAADHPARKDFCTMPFLAELGSLTNNSYHSNVTRSVPKLDSDPADLLASFDSAASRYNSSTTNLFSESKRGVDFMTSSTSRDSNNYPGAAKITNAEYALARLKGTINPAAQEQQPRQQQNQQVISKSFSQSLQDTSYRFQYDQVTGMRVV